MTARGQQEPLATLGSRIWWPMKITEYVSEHRQGFKKTKADIVKRWNERVLPRGLNTQGRNGAAAYLTAYGKGISAEKVVDLALVAESEGAPEMAAGFWEKAFELAEGRFEPFVVEGSPGEAVSIRVATARSIAAPTLAGIPEALQPGKVSTMQPKDAPHPQEHYIKNPNFWGERKRDGKRTVLFGTPERIVHQGRSTNVMAPFDLGFDQAAQRVAEDLGAFILDAETYYVSASGSEHRSAAQAATANIKMGCGNIAPVACLAVIRAIFTNNRDLRGERESVRISAAIPFVAALEAALKGVPNTMVEQLKPACTEDEKRALCTQQKSEGREGEVWVRHDCKYAAGDASPELTVRTKYLSEADFLVSDIVLSDADGRLIKSLALVTNDADRRPVGNVGSGFDSENSAKLLRLHATAPGTVLVKMRFQGYTENDQLWQPRFLDFA